MDSVRWEQAPTMRLTSNSSSVAAQVAVAVDNAEPPNAQVYQQELARERDRLRLLLEVNNALVSTLDLHQLLSAISACLLRR